MVYAVALVFSLVVVWLGIMTCTQPSTSKNISSDDVLTWRDLLSSYFTWPNHRVEPLPISLWLIPPPEQVDQLSPLIKELSRLQPDSSTPFLPHITITWGGVVANKDELHKVAQAIQDELLQQDDLKDGIECPFETFPQTSLDHDHNVVWTQAFILKMKISQSFERICQASRRALNMDDDVAKYCHNPHMSVLYTNDYPTDQVEDVASDELLGGHLLPLKFTANRVALYSIDPVSVSGVREWQPVSEFYL